MVEKFDFVWEHEGCGPVLEADEVHVAVEVVDFFHNLHRLCEPDPAFVISHRLE